MNKSGMRILVRRDLKDEDANNYRWTNDEIDRMVDRAIREYSQVRPYEQKAIIATTNASRIISISTLTGVVLIYAVEFPVDKYPRQYQRFTLQGTDIEMLDQVGDGNNSYVYYGKMHDIEAITWTIQVQHEHIIALGAMAYALLQYGAYSVNRVNVGGAYTVSNALSWGQQKLDEFNKALKRLKSKIKSSSLYVPAIPLQSKTTDWGP